MSDDCMARAISKVKRALMAPTGCNKGSYVFTCTSSGSDKFSHLRPLSSDKEMSSLGHSAVALGPSIKGADVLRDKSNFLSSTCASCLFPLFTARRREIG